jgi:hypothetical protein
MLRRAHPVARGPQRARRWLGTDGLGGDIGAEPAVTSRKAPVGSCRPWLTTTSATNCLAAASRQPAKSKVTMGDGLYSWLPMIADRLVSYPVEGPRK